MSHMRLVVSLGLLSWYSGALLAAGIEPDFLAAQKAGGSDTDFGYGIAVDASGAKYVTGKFKGTAAFGATNLVSAGDYDMFVAKYDAAGTLQWVQKAGGTGDDEGRGVAVDPEGNCYVTGFFSGKATFGAGNLQSVGLKDGFVAKYSRQGTLMWSLRAGGSGDDQGNGIAANATHCYVTGGFQNTASFATPTGETNLVSRGGMDVFVAKFNAASGALVYLYQIGGSGDDQGNGIAVASTGAFYVAGTFSGIATFGMSYLESKGGKDAFIADFGSVGSVDYLNGYEQAGGPEDDEGIGVAVDSQLYPCLVGNFRGTAELNRFRLTSVGNVDCFLAKYGVTDLDALWAQSVGTSQGDTVGGVAVDSSRSWYVVGTSNNNAFVHKYDLNGELAWSRSTGGSGIDYGLGIAVDSEGQVAVVGRFSGTVTFGATSLTSSGLEDVLIADVGISVPDQERTVWLPSRVGVSGRPIEVPVLFLAKGDENALGFSLNYDGGLLKNFRAALVAGVSNVNLTVNTNQAEAGKVGVMIALPAGRVFTAGIRQVATLSFTIAANTFATNAIIAFGDDPIIRQVVDAGANPVPAAFEDGLITLAVFGYEADVAPRPLGNTNVSTIDWVQIGRFVARLDEVANANEFARADCAPRMAAGQLVKGDGAITIADWVQAGRYHAGLDELTAVGGPAGPLSRAQFVSTRRASVSAMTACAVQIQAPVFASGRTNYVVVTLDALGDENALGFSLDFDPAVLEFAGANLGSGAGAAMLNVNANQSQAGYLGLALALPAGQSLSSGPQDLLQVGFTVVGGGSRRTTELAFADRPVAREVSDAIARVIPASYDGATIEVSGSAVLSPRFTQSRMTPNGFSLSFGAESPGRFGLETSPNLRDWTRLATPEFSSDPAQFTDREATNDLQRFYRLVAP